MAPFVCEVCCLPVPERWNRLEQRIEYRRISDQGRDKVRKLRDICRSCMEKAESKVHPGQASLLGGGA